MPLKPKKSAAPPPPPARLVLEATVAVGVPFYGYSLRLSRAGHAARDRFLQANANRRVRVTLELCE